jgi:hypothetical protein
MLKPKYGSFTESVQDFNRMLDGMNKVQPLERSFSDDLQEMFRDEQAMVQIEQQIEHITKVIADSGAEVSEEDANNLAQMHRQAAAAYSQAAQKAENRLAAAKRYGSTETIAKMENVRNRMRLKAEDHAAQAKMRAPQKVVSESVQPKRSSSMMKTMRMLAGIEESATAGLPRDPGLLGTTLFTEGYDKMTEPFAVRPSTKGAREHEVLREKDPGEKVRLKKSLDFLKGHKSNGIKEGTCDDEHERAEKKDIKKIKASADKLDRMHKNVK